MQKHLLLTLLFTAVFAVTSFSQSTNKDSITISKRGLGDIKYFQGTTRLTGKQVGTIMLPNTDATTQWKKSRTNLTLAYVFGIIGGAMVGYELGSALSGKDTNGAVIGIGAGMVGLSIVFGINSDKKAKRAVSTYNTSFR